MEKNTSNSEKDISGRLKILLISFILFTFLIFGVFFTVLIKKVFDANKENQWESRFETLGDRLKENNLQTKAIEQYKKFLGQSNINMKKRAFVSFKIGELFMYSGNCPEALVWFFQSDIADGTFPQKEKLNSNIRVCLEKIKKKPHEN